MEAVALRRGVQVGPQLQLSVWEEEPLLVLLAIGAHKIVEPQDDLVGALDVLSEVLVSNHAVSAYGGPAEG